MNMPLKIPLIVTLFFDIIYTIKTPIAESTSPVLAFNNGIININAEHDNIKILFFLSPYEKTITIINETTYPKASKMFFANP
jgi:hypothetical protein